MKEKASFVAQLVQNLSAMQETWVQFLGQEDPLEKEMAPHSSILAWRIPWTEEPGGLQPTGVAKSRTRLSDFTSFTSIYRERERQREGHREREVVSDSLQPHGL